MKHCPNLDCPHYRAVGSPAEYVADLAACSDCGAELVEGEVAEASPAEAKSTSERAKRLVVSLLALPVIFVLPWIVLPGVDLDAIQSRTSGFPLVLSLRPQAALGVFATGLTPLLTAAVLVGLVTLVVPRWRDLHDDPTGQRRILLGTLILTAILTVMQAYGIANFLVQFPGFFAGSVPLTVLTLTAGSMVLILAADRLGRHGLANGFSVVLAASALGTEVERVATRILQPEPPAPGDIALLVATPIVSVYALMRLLDPVRRAAIRPAEGPGAYRRRGDRDDDRSAIAPPRLRLPSSGIAPLVAGAWLLSPAGADAWSWLGMSALAQLAYGNLAPAVLPAAVAVAIALVLSFGLHPADRVARLWYRVGPGDVLDPSALALAQAEVRRAALRSAALLGAIAGLTHFAHRALPGFPSATNLFVLAAVALDLRAEWRARRASDLVTVAVKHDIDAADAALAALGEAGITAHARGASHRSLLQIFGVYVPVELMVAPDQADRAREIVGPPEIAKEADSDEADKAPKPRKRRRPKDVTPTA